MTFGGHSNIIFLLPIATNYISLVALSNKLYFSSCHGDGLFLSLLSLAATFTICVASRGLVGCRCFQVVQSSLIASQSLVMYDWYLSY